MSFFTLILIILFAGVVVFLIDRAPFVDVQYKSFAKWAILACVVVYILFAIFGGSTGFHDFRIGR
jgi:branched-subunit amino acid transport protein